MDSMPIGGTLTWFLVMHVALDVARQQPYTGTIICHLSLITSEPCVRALAGRANSGCDDFSDMWCSTDIVRKVYAYLLSCRLGNDMYLQVHGRLSVLWSVKARRNGSGGQA